MAGNGMGVPRPFWDPLPIIQYPALSPRHPPPLKYPPTCIQPLNHQIQLGNSNIWTSYLVVYDL